jgi:hypothetical protein
MLGMMRTATIAAAALAWPALAIAGQPAGEVLAAKGESFATSEGKRATLKVGDKVEVGDVVEVPETAKLKLRMIDGSVLSAAPGTKVTIQTYVAEPRDAKLALASGLLRAVVAKAGDPAKFEVDTATGVAAVRSTDWFILADPKGTQVGVLDGKVSLASTATHHAVDIPARWGARVEPGRDPVPARVWSQAEFDNVIGRTNTD